MWHAYYFCKLKNTYTHNNIFIRIHLKSRVLGDQRGTLEDFPGPVVENPPANAGDMGCIPGSGIFHVPMGNVSAPQLLTCAL